MQRKFIQVAIVAFSVVIVAILGSLITQANLNWYYALHIPFWTPDGSLIGKVWTLLYILLAVAVSLSLLKKNKIKEGQKQNIWRGFAVNLFFNFLWTAVFFGKHVIGAGIVGAFLLFLSVLALISLVFPVNRTAAALLLPYALWVLYAAYLNYEIWIYN